MQKRSFLSDLGFELLLLSMLLVPVAIAIEEIGVERFVNFFL